MQYNAVSTYKNKLKSLNGTSLQSLLPAIIHPKSQHITYNDPQGTAANISCCLKQHVTNTAVLLVRGPTKL